MAYKRKSWRPFSTLPPRAGACPAPEDIEVKSPRLHSKLVWPKTPPVDYGAQWKSAPSWIFSPLPLEEREQEGGPLQAIIKIWTTKTSLREGDFRMVLSFGKHSGKDLKDVPHDYVEWLRKRAEDDLKIYQGELERRESLEAASEGIMERIVKEGFRALSKKAHPDAGGTTQDFLELKGGQESLLEILKELKK